MLQEKSYDAIVVGSGFAGAIVAAKLGKEGVNPSNGERLKVALIEWGPYFKGKPNWGYGTPLRRRMFTHIPQDMLRARSRYLTPWESGKIVGGSSTHWGAKGNPPDDKDYDLWARETGVNWTKESFKSAVDELLRLWNSHPVPDDLLLDYHRKFRDAAQAMGYQTGKILVHKKNCIMCGTHFERQPQCRYDAKMSTLLSHIPIAEENGVEILPDTKVEQVIIEKKGARGVATGVWYREKNQSPQKAEAKKVILACGYMGTPLLLYASGYGPKEVVGDKLIAENPNVGANLDGHVRDISGGASAYFGEIVHEVGDGNFGYYILDDKDRQASDRLFILSGADTEDPGGAEYYALHDWAPQFGHRHKDWMRNREWRHVARAWVAYSHTTVPLGRITPEGTQSFHTSHPVIQTRRHEAYELIKSLFEKMGASKTSPPPTTWTGEAERRPLLHAVSTCRAGADRKNSVIDSDFQCHDVENLFIVDSSSVPRQTSLWSGGTVAAVIGTFGAQRIIANHFKRAPG